MDAGAAKAGVVIQYCMLWPRMALASLEFPTVTTVRTHYHAHARYYAVSRARKSPRHLRRRSTENVQ